MKKLITILIITLSLSGCSNFHQASYVEIPAKYSMFTNQGILYVESTRPNDEHVNFLLEIDRESVLDDLEYYLYVRNIRYDENDDTYVSNLNGEEIEYYIITRDNLIEAE